MEANRQFEDFFRDATSFTPYDWQTLVATQGLPSVLPVPTGLGKTEGVALGWAWQRTVNIHCEPAHLIYCLPIRTLVRQTIERLRTYFTELKRKRGIEIDVFELMGGSIDEEWARWPDKSWVLVGTQDQLLSRALNRGYSMNRFEWPVHFGLLNQDCRWIIDEVQLMGPGLWTTAQLDWMRQRRFASLKPCTTTWMSATVGKAFLSTADRRSDKLDVLKPQEQTFLCKISETIEQDRNVEARNRCTARRATDWFKRSDQSSTLTLRIADDVCTRHCPGTLSLVVCNTVDAANKLYDSLTVDHKVLLTSRFRRQDRERHEKRLLDFERRRRQHAGKPVANNSGLICVSTQVVEAGADFSAHLLWSELPPWPSVIQRLGRLNRDGLDQDARAWFWETPREGRSKQQRIGPYDTSDVARAKTLVDALIPASKVNTFADALRVVANAHASEIEAALNPKPEPLPRALDVHGLFSTERDLYGGFTDVSAFVRGVDAEADLTVFWREWRGNRPPEGEDLDGPDVDLPAEGCPLAVYRLRDVLKSRRVQAWIWNEEDERWDQVSADELCPGMTVMLHREVGGYRTDRGWTGNGGDIVADVPRAGRGRALRDDPRTELGYWAELSVHLDDARREADLLCRAVGLTEPLRVAVVEAAGLHDLGKAHPQWQQALPGGAALPGRLWAKCPRIVAVDAVLHQKEIRDAFQTVRPGALALPEERRDRGNEKIVRLRWAVEKKLSRDELSSLTRINGARWAGHVPFRPGLRHEAASALAMWKLYREGKAAFPALAVYLAATHHGKIRTVLRSTTDDGNDVFGVRPNLDALEFGSRKWPLDFSVSKDGAQGGWQEDCFVLTDHGWTAIVAELLGPWRTDDANAADVVPENEPRKLGPFALAYLEALVRVADWRASERPSKSTKPQEIAIRD